MFATTCRPRALVMRWRNPAWPCRVFFETVLDPGLARVRGARIARRVEALDVVGVQRSDIADRMREQVIVRIVAYQSRLEINTGESRPLNSKLRNLLFGHAEFQRDGFKSLATAAQRFETRNFSRLDQLDRRQAIQGVVNVCDLFGYQFELVGRKVLGDDTAFAIKNQAAYGGHGLNAYAITLGLFRE